MNSSLFRQTLPHLSFESDPATVSDDEDSCSMGNPTKSVRFHPFVDVIPLSSPLDKIDDSHAFHEIWYQRDELNFFRAEARDLCRKMRAADGETRECSLIRDDECTRGLEQRTCLERQKRKFISTKYIVKAQSKVNYNGEKLAQIAQHFTSYAMALAIEEASRDYRRAYPFRGEKRVSDFETEEYTRSVRPRLSAPIFST